MLSFIRKHPIGVGAGAAVLLAGLAWLAFGFFGVQTLFIDDVVDEAGPAFDATPAALDTGVVAEPVAEAAVAAPEPAEATTPQIVTEFAGSFESGAHPTVGTATVLGNGTDQRFLRFEAFETDNGPDLNVYLFNVNGDRNDYIDLGDLKGNIGDQNYEIPADVDLSVYGEVSIWCVRFGVGFGDALLMAA